MSSFASSLASSYVISIITQRYLPARVTFSEPLATRDLLLSDFRSQEVKSTIIPIDIQVYR